MRAKNSNAPDLSTYLRSIKKRFNTALLKWWKKNAREYPWRKPGTSPYEVLIAEVLLKRTTATAAERIFNKILKAYPDIKSLSTAKSRKLETLLGPIGLYKQRAKGLRETALYLRDKEKGKIPKDLEKLLMVPHIGPYAARAILSFGYDIPMAIVDSNVIRVLNCAFSGMISKKATLGEYQSVVDILLSRKYHKEFNWALLDLGAKKCHYSRRACKDCPLINLCARYKKEFTD